MSTGGLVTRFLAAVYFFFLLFPLASRSDEFHYNNMFVGERPTGMGGAYVAISDDAAGLYYNPAGIVYAQGDSISGSVNAFQITNYHYSKVGEGDIDWDRRSTAFVPNYFGIIKQTSFGSIGISYAVVDSLFEDQDQINFDLPASDPEDHVTKSRVNYNNDENTYNFGPTFAAKVSKNFSFGATLYVHYRKVQFVDNEITEFSDREGFTWTDWYNQYWEETEWGLRPILGFMWSPEDKNFSLGLTVSRTYVLSSKNQSQIVNVTFYDEYSEVFLNDDYQGNEHRSYPTVLTLGGAYFPSHSLLLSGDITYYTNTSDDQFGDRRSFVNVAMGAEYYFSQSFALRGGAFTNLANTYRPGDREDQSEHVDMYGAALSMSFFTRGKSLTLGATYSFGDGKTLVGQFNEPNTINDMSISTLMVFLGASSSI